MEKNIILDNIYWRHLLLDISHLQEHAVDEGWGNISDERVLETKELIQRMFVCHEPCSSYMVYPCPDSEIVVDVGEGIYRIVVSLFENENIIYVYQNDEGETLTRTHSSISEIPDDFMISLLQRLNRKDELEFMEIFEYDDDGNAFKYWNWFKRNYKVITDQEGRFWMRVVDFQAYNDDVQNNLTKADYDL